MSTYIYCSYECAWTSLLSKLMSMHVRRRSPWKSCKSELEFGAWRELDSEIEVAFYLSEKGKKAKNGAASTTLALKQILVDSGVINRNYTEVIQVILVNKSNLLFQIKIGD